MSGLIDWRSAAAVILTLAALNTGAGRDLPFNPRAVIPFLTKFPHLGSRIMGRCPSETVTQFSRNLST